MRTTERSEPKTYSVIVTWREGEAELFSLTEERFAAVRQSWIDEGYFNLQTEWYERREGSLPDRFRVFVYWEDAADVAPSLEQLHAWGLQAVELNVVG